MKKKKTKKNNKEFLLYSPPYFNTKSLVKRYTYLESLSHYNLGRNIVDK